ncbi:MAG: hypothetical protein ACP5IE_03655 [Infirmifilum sp.]
MAALAMITYNSAERLGELFREVLTSLLSIPYKAFIFVSDSNNDKTFNEVVRFVSEHGKKSIAMHSRLSIGQSKSTSATAGEMAINIFFGNFNDELLMFLGDIFILSAGYWREESNDRQSLDFNLFS